MSARRLRRLAGLLLALVVTAGAVGTAVVLGADDAISASEVTAQVIDWS